MADDSRVAIRRRVAAHPHHLMLVSDFYSRDCDQVKKVLELILEFWSTQWRDVKLRRVLLHCLCVRYEHGDPARPAEERQVWDQRAKDLADFIEGLVLSQYEEFSPSSSIGWRESSGPTSGIGGVWSTRN
ncbi:MAG: hypothetical protein IPJ27_14085 [Candidatus Accumulibacter sp.]|uniref:Uncharacterized protein n=1 Tax=Candidatus Accumulibacter proximus TaxID=2954385 RepID=A0A935Q0D5_9PROT|nr:hypothetical protein [Candidatus Accumulibacter proximus]